MKIESIKIKHIIEVQPDLSFLGVYSNSPADVCIDREERGDRGRNECRYFNLGCGDAAYIEEDYKRAEAYNRQQWCMLGIMAEAVVSYPFNEQGHKRLETLSSGGLWGVESDSGDYIAEVENEQLDDLQEHLTHFGITVKDDEWTDLCDKARNNVVETWDT